MKNLTQFGNCGTTIGDRTNYSLNDQSDYHVSNYNKIHVSYLLLLILAQKHANTA